MGRENVSGFCFIDTLRSSVLEDSGDSKRATVVKDVMDSLGSPKRPLVIGIRRGKAATNVAREIFRGMVLGNRPQAQRVKAPTWQGGCVHYTDLGAGEDSCRLVCLMRRSRARPRSRRIK